MQRQLNILATYHRASGFENEAGLRWYLLANEEAKRIGASLLSGDDDERMHRAAAIIAALSPGLRWERNVEAAERLIEGEGLEGLGVRWYDGVRKARRILEGEPILDVLKGNKVRAFYANISAPNNSQRVCVDGHAYAIWEGRRIHLDDVPPISDKLYLRIEEDYRTAAELVGVRPWQLQAITWTAWRRIHEVNASHFLPLFEEV